MKAAEPSSNVPGLKRDKSSSRSGEWSVPPQGIHERREFLACPSPWPASGGIDHGFVSTNTVACINHTLHWKLNLIGFEAKCFQQLYVFFCLGKKFEHTFFSLRRVLSLFQLSEHKGHLSILVKFSRCLFWIDGFEQEQFVILALPPLQHHKESALCRYIIISFPEEAARLKIERMGWKILGLNQRSNLTDGCKREWRCVDLPGW